MVLWSIISSPSLRASTTQTIHEVGTSVGIPDPKYLNKQFRKIVGMSPGHYRDHNMEFLSNMPTTLATKKVNGYNPNRGDNDYPAPIKMDLNIHQNKKHSIYTYLLIENS